MFGFIMKNAKNIYIYIIVKKICIFLNYLIHKQKS